jgi:hypothetical protein
MPQSIRIPFLWAPEPKVSSWQEPVTPVVAPWWEILIMGTIPCSQKTNNQTILSPDLDDGSF